MNFRLIEYDVQYRPLTVFHCLQLSFLILFDPGENAN
jgi:hypothetical protein